MATSYPPLANGSYRVGDPAQPFPSRTPGPPPQGSLPPGGVYWHGMPRPAARPGPAAPFAQHGAPQATFPAPQAPFAQAPQPGAPYPQPQFAPAPQPAAPFVPVPQPHSMTTGPAADPGVGPAGASGTAAYVDLPRPVAPARRQWIQAALIALAVVIVSVVVLGVGTASAQTTGAAGPAGGLVVER